MKFLPNPISYLLELAGDEYEGDYISTITYSCFALIVTSGIDLGKKVKGFAKRYRFSWD